MLQYESRRSSRRASWILSEHAAAADAFGRRLVWSEHRTPLLDAKAIDPGRRTKVSTKFPFMPYSGVLRPSGNLVSSHGHLDGTSPAIHANTLGQEVWTLQMSAQASTRPAIPTQRSTAISCPPDGAPRERDAALGDKPPVSRVHRA